MFAAVYRGILFRCGITPSNCGNVQPQDGTDLLGENSDSSEEDDLPLPPIITLTKFVEDIVEYISGWLARSLQKKLKCTDCALALTSTQAAPTPNSLISVKDRGGLLFPSYSVKKICKVSERRYRSGQQAGANFILSVMSDLEGTHVFTSLSQHHADTLDGIDSHVTSLVRLIVSTYFNLRQHQSCKLRNLEMHRSRMRSQFTNRLHFQYHQ